MSELVCLHCGVGIVGGDWCLCDACAEEERARELGSEYLDDLECSVQNSTGAWIAWGIGRGDFENLCGSIDDSDKITIRGVFSEYREELTGAEFKSLYGGAE